MALDLFLATNVCVVHMTANRSRVCKIQTLPPPAQNRFGRTPLTKPRRQPQVQGLCAGLGCEPEGELPRGAHPEGAQQQPKEGLRFVTEARGKARKTGQKGKMREERSLAQSRRIHHK